jgi:hypothetical protein
MGAKMRFPDMHKLTPEGQLAYASQSSDRGFWAFIDEKSSKPIYAFTGSSRSGFASTYQCYLSFDHSSLKEKDFISEEKEGEPLLGAVGLCSTTVTWAASLKDVKRAPSGWKRLSDQDALMLLDATDRVNLAARLDVDAKKR